VHAAQHGRERVAGGDDDDALRILALDARDLGTDAQIGRREVLVGDDAHVLEIGPVHRHLAEHVVALPRRVDRRNDRDLLVAAVAHELVDGRTM